VQIEELQLQLFITFINMKVIKTNSTIPILKWLPLTAFILILIKITYQLYELKTSQLNQDAKLMAIDYMDDMQIVIIVLVILSFFIRNWLLKLITMIIGILVLIFSFYFVGDFNPY